MDKINQILERCRDQIKSRPFPIANSLMVDLNESDNLKLLAFQTEDRLLTEHKSLSLCLKEMTINYIIYHESIGMTSLRGKFNRFIEMG